MDEFEASPQAQSTKTVRFLSAKKIMKLHKQGFEVMPKSLQATLDTLQPTSVPAERLFSKARHARRYSQENQSDERFTSYLLLKEY